MAWFGNLGSLGNLGDLAGAVNNLGDLAGAVNKISEGVKSIELNFDAALLGLEEKDVSVKEEKPESLPTLNKNEESSDTLKLFPVEDSVDQQDEINTDNQDGWVSLPEVDENLEVKQENETSVAKNLQEDEEASIATIQAEKSIPEHVTEAHDQFENTNTEVNEALEGSKSPSPLDIVEKSENIDPLVEYETLNEVPPTAEKVEEESPEVSQVEAETVVPVSDTLDFINSPLQDLSQVEPSEQEKHPPLVDIPQDEPISESTIPVEGEEENLEKSGVEEVFESQIVKETDSKETDLEKTEEVEEVEENEIEVSQSVISGTEAETKEINTETVNKEVNTESENQEIDAELKNKEFSSEIVEKERLEHLAEPETKLEGQPQVDSRSEEMVFEEPFVSPPSLPVETQNKVPKKERNEEPESIAEGPEGEQKLRAEISHLEVALQSAARQAQVKADELSKFMLLNDELKGEVQALRHQVDNAKEKEKLAVEAAMDALREEYQHRISAAERKVYALTKERDMLRREQSRKTDTSALLKEKDEIIKQVMAEGEELSKKQASQEQAMKKLRSQIRELEDDKQRLNARLQVEEARVESVKKDKAGSEKALQDQLERAHADLASQKEFFTTALAEARASLAEAEARADSGARAELERKVREGAEREKALSESVEELRQGLTRAEQQASLREEMLRRDLEATERRCQEAETRHEELLARIPDSTRPLLRQIEAMQEAANMKVEVISGVEKALTGRLQEAQVKAAAAEERERATSERLSQTLSRLSVMETQLGLLRVEQSQLTRSLEKERARASESRQEHLASLEKAATEEGKVQQLEEELKETQARLRRELQQEKARRQQLEQELAQAVDREREKERERERERERVGGAFSPHPLVENSSIFGHSGQLKSFSVGGPASVSRSSSVSSLGMDGAERESSILAASLTPTPLIPLPLASPSASGRLGMRTAASQEQMESVLRQREGELSTWAARVVALESTRDSLAEELVKSSQQCEQLRTEVNSLAGARAELEALRKRHSSALELMGERDEQVEELRADLADVKQMYREQIDLLVNQIQDLSAQVSAISLQK